MPRYNAAGTGTRYSSFTNWNYSNYSDRATLASRTTLVLVQELTVLVVTVVDAVGRSFGKVNHE